MSDETKIHPPKGMRDWGPKEVLLRARLMETIARAYRLYGFSPIDTPAVENLEVLLGKGGGENEKLLFKILKRGEELERANQGDWADLGLRFDLTVPLARYVAKHLNEIPKIFRCYHMAPVWRADRPQKGRFREFYQCDIDIVGASTSACEVEILTASERALNSLGIGKVKLRISDKRLLPLMLTPLGVPDEKKSAVCTALDKLDKKPVPEVLEEIKTHLPDISVFHKVREWITAMKSGDAVRLMPSELALSVGAVDGQLKEVLEGITVIVENCRLANPESSVQFDPLLVRGMDYYTGPVFEAGLEGLPYSIGGGGRYDKLIGHFAGKEIPAVGFSIGFERILSVLLEQAGTASAPQHKVFLANTGQNEIEVHRVAELLRNAGIPVEAWYGNDDLGKQMKIAEASGAPYAVRGFDPSTHIVIVRKLSERKDYEMTVAQLKNAILPEHLG